MGCSLLLLQRCPSAFAGESLRRARSKALDSRRAGVRSRTRCSVDRQSEQRRSGVGLHPLARAAPDAARPRAHGAGTAGVALIASIAHTKNSRTETANPGSIVGRVSSSSMLSSRGIASCCRSDHAGVSALPSAEPSLPPARPENLNPEGGRIARPSGDRSVKPLLWTWKTASFE